MPCWWVNVKVLYFTHLEFLLGGVDPNLAKEITKNLGRHQSASFRVKLGKSLLTVWYENLVFCFVSNIGKAFFAVFLYVYLCVQLNLSEHLKKISSMVHRIATIWMFFKRPEVTEWHLLQWKGVIQENKQAAIMPHPVWDFWISLLKHLKEQLELCFCNYLFSVKPYSGLTCTRVQGPKAV